MTVDMTDQLIVVDMTDDMTVDITDEMTVDI